MIYIVLLEPEKEGNIGAVARAIANFGFKKLVLVNPKCDHLSQTAVRRAKHGKNILKRAEVHDKLRLKTFDYLIGTTAKLGTDYNLARSPITPRQLASSLPKKGEIALLFGREGIGLTNKEIASCDFVVHIPATTKYPTLNLSHAVTIILYELTQAAAQEAIANKFVPAGRKEKELLLKRVDAILDKMKFATASKKETQRLVWKRLLNKSFLTRREAFALFGFFRKVK